MNTTAPHPASTPSLFAALAAHETAVENTFTPGPADLRRLLDHLLALGPTAPADLHLLLLDAHGAVEDARDTLTAARGLQARNAAFAQVVAAVQGARAAILALAPHADRMHGTDLPATADDVRAAALAYNAVEGAPEELAAARAGTPTVRVHCRSDTGTGWNVTARITAGVDSPLGHIPAHPPVVVTFRKRDGRLDAAANARRVIGALFQVGIPVEYVTGRQF